MTIETKFNVGDSIICMYEDEIYHQKVRDISINISDGEVHVSYKIDAPEGGILYISEDRCFETVDQLLKQLSKNYYSSLNPEERELILPF